MSLAPAKRSGGYGNAGRPSVIPLVRPRYVVGVLRFLFVDQLISNLHTGIILGISSLGSKLGKIRPEECNSDTCDLKMATIAAIMVAILAVLFNMVAKTHTNFEVLQCSNTTKKIDIYGFLE